VTRYWLGVVQRSHVLRAVELGIAQVNHGSVAIRRLAVGDVLVYYSPKTAYPEGDPLREFTAIGRVEQGEAFQAEDDDFHPWRRAVAYDTRARSAPITPLLGDLDLSRENRNWGYQLRRGILEMSEHDARVVAAAMGSGILGE
jgi:hypothetical protein